MPAVADDHATLATRRPASALPGPDFHRLDRTSLAWRTHHATHFGMHVGHSARMAKGPNFKLELRYLSPPAITLDKGLRKGMLNVTELINDEAMRRVGTPLFDNLAKSRFPRTPDPGRTGSLLDRC